MHHAKKKEIPLAILSRILAQSCVTSPYIILSRQRVPHDCASILDSIAKGISLFPRFFCMVHPIPTSPFIQLKKKKKMMMMMTKTRFSEFLYTKRTGVVSDSMIVFR